MDLSNANSSFRSAPLSPKKPGPASAGTDVFIGRQDALRRLDLALQAARSGQPQVVVVQGPAGVGKTALVRHFLDRADERRVLRMRGEEIETTLPYGVVERLAAEVGAELPDPLGRLADSHGEGSDVLAVGAALVDLLGVLQQAGPVVLVIDDAHWADTPSLHSLTFALRRLRVDRVLAIIVTRDLADADIPSTVRRALADEHSSHLELSGLTVPELRSLADQLGIAHLPKRALQRLHDDTQGSPLHARALLEEVPAETLREGSQPLPAPRSFAQLILRRLASLPSQVGDLAAAAAVLGGMCLLELAGQLAELTNPLAALDQAIAARLLEERPGASGLMIAFCHPLIRSAVYHALGPARRTKLHARAATLIHNDDEAMALQHQVLAATGTDRRLATDMATFARRQMAAGLWVSAADGLTAAARLLRPGREQDKLLLEAVECMLLAGDVDRAASSARRLESVRDACWREYIFGRLALVTGRLPEAEARLHRAWHSCDRTADALLGARVAGMLAYLCIMAARSLEGVRWAERALRLDPTGSGTDMIRYLQLIGWATAGRPDDALKLAVGLPDPAHASIAELDALLGRGLVRTWTDDLAGAQADLVGLVAACRDRSAAFRILALTALGQVEFRRGHWDDALVHAEVAASLANDTDQLWVAPYAHATAAFVLAGRGAWTEAEAHLVAGWAATSGPDYPPQMVYPALAEALMRRAQGDSVGVVRALRSLLAFENLDGFNEPGVVPWHDVLADALVAIGEYQEAAALLGRWETRVAERGRRSVQLAVSRARGNLAAAQGDQHAAEEAFRAGLRYAEQVDEPFGRALLQAAYGGFLRRSGQRSAAAAQLKAARATFAQLEAHPYLERCERELAGCGLTPAKRGERSSVGLTPQELAVARLAATGLTNRQVAAELIVSVKTVEYHLAKVYAKLAIGSRAELGTRLKS